MDILAIFTKRRSYMSSVEDTSILLEGQTEYKTSFNTNPNLFNVQQCTCTPEVFEVVKPLAGTTESPALIQSAVAAPVPNRLNVYIENGELKVVA